jgi:hypothetical protein
MVSDLVGDALAATEARRYQGEGIAPVEGGTRRTERLPSGPTRLEQHPVGQGPGIEEHPPSFVNSPGDPSRKADRAPAGPGATHLGAEGVEATRGIQAGEDASHDSPVDADIGAAQLT